MLSYGYFRREGDPIPIEQEQPCIRGIMRSMSVQLGPNYYEALLIADCRDPAGNTEFILCRERELQGMMALGISYTRCLRYHCHKRSVGQVNSAFAATLIYRRQSKTHLRAHKVF